MRDVYGVMSTGHYNEQFAREDVSKMYYMDRSGKRHDAPYWTESAVRAIYDKHINEIPDYNFWDFYVTMNMVASDSWCMLAKWFPNGTQDDMNERITEMSINWLSDDDWPNETKVWDYVSDR